VSEQVAILVNQPDEFDRAVHGDDAMPALPSGNDLTIITKDGGMQSGRAVACITFTAEVDGKLWRAQYSVGVRQLMLALHFLRAGYTEDGMPLPGTFGRP
jgi:hypothetical protein